MSTIDDIRGLKVKPGDNVVAIVTKLRDERSGNRFPVEAKKIFLFP